MAYDSCLQLYYFWNIDIKIEDCARSVIIITCFEHYAKVSKLSLDAILAWIFFFFTIFMLLFLARAGKKQKTHRFEDWKSISKDNPKK